MPTLGTYCGTAATLNVSGTWLRFGPLGFGSGDGGTEHKQEWLTMFYKTCVSPNYRTNLGSYVGPDGTTSYCADGDIHVVNVQTDCSGNYAFSVAGQSIICAGVVTGKWIANPGYSPLDLVYNPVTQNWVQYILDPSTQYRYCGLSVYAGTYGTHFEALPAGYTNGTAAGSFTDVSPDPSSCGSSQNPLYGRPTQNGGGVFVLSGSYGIVSGSLRLVTPLSGTFIIPLRDDSYSEGQGFLTNMIRGGHWYYVANAVYQITDACGTVENTTLTTPGGGIPNGGATWSTIDWANITSVVLTSAVPSPGWIDGYPSPSDSNVWGPYTNPESTGTGRTPWNYGTAFSPFIHDCCQHSFNLNVILVPPLPVSPIVMVADYCEGVISVAWVDQANNLKICNNRSASAHIGSIMDFWDTPYIQDTSVTKMGMVYLNNKSLYLEYTGGTHTAYLNSSFGMQGDWTFVPGIVTGFTNGIPGSRKRAVTAMVEFGPVDLDAKIDYSNNGHFSSGSNIGLKPLYDRAALIDTGQKYIALWTTYDITSSTNTTHISHIASTGASWGSASVVSAITGYVASGVLLPSYTILGLSYDPASKLCTAFRSRNQGATWELDGSTIPAIPVMDLPPMLVSTNVGAYAVWVLNDQVYSAFSSDEGKTWT